MGDYNKEIRELSNEICKLNLVKNEKDIQLKKLLQDQKESTKRESSPVQKYQARAIIRIGGWVKATISGRFKIVEGTVKKFNKWVTFEDCTGVKQVRAPKNLLVGDHEKKRAS